MGVVGVGVCWRGPKLTAIVQVQLLVLCSMLSTLHHKPENKERDKKVICERIMKFLSGLVLSHTLVYIGQIGEAELC